MILKRKSDGMRADKEEMRNRLEAQSFVEDGFSFDDTVCPRFYALQASNVWNFRFIKVRSLLISASCSQKRI